MFTTLFRISVLLFIYFFFFYFSASVCANIQSFVYLCCDELNFIQQRRGRKTQIFFKLEFSPFWPRIQDDKERKYKLMLSSLLILVNSNRPVLLLQGRVDYMDAIELYLKPNYIFSKDLKPNC